MRKIAATQPATERALTQGGIETGQIRRARGSAALADTVGDGLDIRMQAHWLPAMRNGGKEKLF
ncbi:hypothetical protein BRN45_06315 [Xanthomonas oryzae pv. oryzae]|nr:hypothetical protein BRN26_03015 [Xanthomonas oryzae pv. oryzae]RBC58109.1 hypothetical protein BRN15_17160 [Xanthomonas oryzae pv. oryzae]RBD09579.1 hypothetical protein BRM79_13560 [Xanthomonas oryzae pv. oryzae]RBE88900.1 hypothetical protein BRL73_10560 [Xanthomonas oryzae pv. oryzae]RBF35928.1 hypothetical protein BRN08_09120 [Xanthomonas oryzae pv. oryzae]